MASIQGKVAIVTGSARGIGAGIAARFGKEGVKVIFGELGDYQRAVFGDDHLVFDAGAHMPLAIIGLHSDDHAFLQLHRMLQREATLDHGPLPQAYAQSMAKCQAKCLTFIFKAPVLEIRPCIHDICCGVAYPTFINSGQQHLIGTVIHSLCLVRGFTAAQRPVITGVVAIEQCAEIRKYHIARLDHTIRGQMRVGMCPGARGHLDIMYPL